MNKFNKQIIMNHFLLLLLLLVFYYYEYLFIERNVILFKIIFNSQIKFFIKKNSRLIFIFFVRYLNT